ncbi:MAG: hypothetical protein CHACPFDD_01727 [Phycisphaerae bacterium]|nr:hypothetical protein [Phycisphaerae bacterium]
MDAQEIVKLTPQAIQEILQARLPAGAEDSRTSEQRRTARWPFPGTVEVWLPDGEYGERHLLATLHNLSPNGLAMRSRRAIHAGTLIALALHQPELSCYGDALVRHCTRSHTGYLVGVEFVFRDSDD